MLREGAVTATIPSHHGEAWKSLSEAHCSRLPGGRSGCDFIDHAHACKKESGLNHERRLQEIATTMRDEICADCPMNNWALQGNRWQRSARAILTELNIRN